MTLTLDNNEVLTSRFASCTGGLWLLKTLTEAARRAMTGGVCVSPAGLKFCDDFSPTPMNKINLAAAKFAEGEFRREKNQPTSKKGRNQRQINE
jgi:hypothetical protein